MIGSHEQQATTLVEERPTPTPFCGFVNGLRTLGAQRPDFVQARVTHVTPTLP
jgi:hypothetical protein